MTVRVVFLLLWAISLRAELLDRIAVSLDNNVITEQQVLQQIRLAALQNRQPPQITGSEKRKAANILMERRFISREMNANHYPVPDQAAVTALLKQFKSERFPSEAAYQEALAQYQLTDAEFRSFLQAQLMTLRFIEVRFAPAIQVTDHDINEYYENQFLPDWKNRSTQPPPLLEKVRDEIEETINRTREDYELNRWLSDTKRQADIRWQQEVFQ